jgi:hypothetical protein
LEDNTPFIEEETPLQDSLEKPHISLHSLFCFSTPQALKLISYIKHHKVIFLIDSGSTHKFIHMQEAKDKHCYVHPISNFQIMSVNGNMMIMWGQK